MDTPPNSFESKIDVVNNELRKRRDKWQLKARTDLDYDDVQQILRIHIYEKWSLWDQSKPLEPWLNTIITNQIRNLLRNLYGGFSRPCLKCAANEGGDLCSIYRTQCAECPLYAKWTKRKKHAYDVKIPLPLENHTQEVESISGDFVDYDKSVKAIHEKVKLRLSNVQRKVYVMLYIENLSEDDVAIRMGYKRNEDKKRRGFRYKQLENHKKTFYELARKIILEEGL